MKLAGPQLKKTILDICPEAEHWPLGVVVDISQAKGAQSDEQRAGWHWLLEQWLELDPAIAKDKEDLKTNLLIAKFGGVHLIDQYGNQSVKPLRRTTQTWEWDSMSYRRKKLTKALYTELIDFTYQTAADDQTILPEME